MKDIDFSASKRVAKLVNAEIGKCATNVATAFLKAREILPNQSQYVEGVLMIGGQSNLHAWIETEDTIIDPTLGVWPKAWLQERTGNDHYPILRYSTDEFLDRLKNEAFTLGAIRELILTDDDPKVKEKRKKIDPP